MKMPGCWCSSSILLALLACCCSLFHVGSAAFPGGRHAWSTRQRMHAHRQLQLRQHFWQTVKRERTMPNAILSEIPQERFLQQPLDHFDRRTKETYKQRYWVNNMNWKKPDGPVFLFIGGEGALSEYDVLAGEHVELSVKYGALVAAVEHRFYGESINPDGLKMENLQYLSSQQALADLASFHAYLVDTYNLTRNNTWICFGGSYPGSLSAWFRLKFPHLVFAAVASSAPVRAQLDFQGYNKVVAASLADEVVGGSDKCLSRVREAFATVDAKLIGKEFSGLERDFKSCVPFAGPDDLALFASNLADIFMSVVQYNREMPNSDIRALCAAMINTERSAYQQLVALNENYLNIEQRNCSDNTYANFVADLSNTTATRVDVGMRQWTYQTCTEFGYYQTCVSERDCPFLQLMTLSWNLDLCGRVFGVDPASVASAVRFTNEYYGADHPRGSRILFVNGDIDPWHALSVLRNETRSEVAIFINGTAHCANMSPTSPSDPPSLTNARLKIDEQVGDWLHLAKRRQLL